MLFVSEMQVKGTGLPIIGDIYLISTLTSALAKVDQYTTGQSDS